MTTLWGGDLADMNMWWAHSSCQQNADVYSISYCFWCWPNFLLFSAFSVDSPLTQGLQVRAGALRILYSGPCLCGLCTRFSSPYRIAICFWGSVSHEVARSLETGLQFLVNEGFSWATLGRLVTCALHFFALGWSQPHWPCGSPAGMALFQCLHFSLHDIHVTFFHFTSALVSGVVFKDQRKEWDSKDSCPCGVSVSIGARH